MFIEDDFIGRRFERLVVVEKVAPYVSPKGYKKSRYKCICDCGNYITIQRNSLVSGLTKSCGCLNDEKRHAPSVLRRDLTGQKFGKLTVLERGPNIIIKSNEQKSTWICQCDCGNIVRVRQSNLLKGATKSCGCIASIGECFTESALRDNYIFYEKEYSFDDLIGKGGGKLRFDFAIFNLFGQLAFLVEYQGAQHYKNIEFGKYEREYTDKLKKEYCKKNDIVLYEITYQENIEEKVKEILLKENMINSI